MSETFTHFRARLWDNYLAHPDELKSLVYLTLAAAFILSFDLWGETAFDAFTGLANLAAAIIICGVSIAIHDCLHRAAAIKMGYEMQHRVWFGGLIFSLILVLASRGGLKTYFFESMAISPVRLHRVGRYPFMGTSWEYSLAYMAGPLASLLLAGVLASIQAASGTTGGLLGMAVSFNLMYGLLALLPLPPLDGIWILYYSRGIYLGLLVGSISYAIMTHVGLTSILPLALAVLIGIAFGSYWMKVHE